MQVFFSSLEMAFHRAAFMVIPCLVALLGLLQVQPSQAVLWSPKQGNGGGNPLSQYLIRPTRAQYPPRSQFGKPGFKSTVCTLGVDCPAWVVVRSPMLAGGLSRHSALLKQTPQAYDPFMGEQSEEEIEEENEGGYYEDGSKQAYKLTNMFNLPQQHPGFRYGKK